MAITSANQCNSFELWWQNTFASLEAVLPLFQQNPSDISLAEIQTYEILLRAASNRVLRNSCPCYATEIEALLITTLCKLQKSLAAQSINESAEAETYLLIARIQWAALQTTLAKHGVMLA
jgi:hypothetical protein